MVQIALHCPFCGSEIEQINKTYFETHGQVNIRPEIDEMWSYYRDKKRQLWLCWAIDHKSGEAIG